MTLQTVNVIPYVISNILMLIIHFIFLMAIQTIEFSIITWICMALVAVSPSFSVLSTINWEISNIVIPIGWLPNCLAVAVGTACWKMRSCMVWRSFIIIGCMTTNTSIWCVCKIAWRMALCAIHCNSGMSTL